jgi:hypothetical protein
MTYIPARTTAQVTGAFEQAIRPQGRGNLPDTAGIQIREGTHDQVHVYGSGPPVHFYSRNKEGIHADKLRTLGYIKDTIGSRFEQASLRRFEASLRAGVRKGDRPLTIRQFVQGSEAAIRERLDTMQIKNTGFAGFKTLGVRGLNRSLGNEMPRVAGFTKRL